jgi:hypothetical protein
VKEALLSAARRPTSHVDVQTCGYGAPTQKKGRMRGKMTIVEALRKITWDDLEIVFTKREQEWLDKQAAASKHARESNFVIRG